MKRYRKNKIYRKISHNKTLFLSSIITFLSILFVVFGLYFNLYPIPLIFCLILYCSLVFALSSLILRTTRTSSVNKRRIELKIANYRHLGDQIGLALSLIEMGILYGVLKEYQRELDHYLQAFNIFDRLQDDHAKAVLYQYIAFTYEKLKEFSLARKNYELGLNLSTERNDGDLIYRYNLLLGEFYEKQGINDKAEAFYSEADRRKKLNRRKKHIYNKLKSII
ncbi:MAG: hypothetical protein ACTSRS_18325 [Candidatus Helarchaeota archaeon]